ncbi:MAG: TIGR01777 family oxidoreductase [Nitrospirota bacterium]|nr:TIGR01777 family oxidoreductase [Nitrospirota bacterium]
MKVLITGSSGLIGSVLIESLASNGHEVIRLLRKKFAKDSPVWDPENDVIDLADVRDIAAVVHLAGDNIAEGRWNDRKKGRIRNSRVRGTKLLAEFFAASEHKPRIIVSASAVGVYGDRGEELVDETSEPGNGFLADVCQQWEGATASAVDAGIRVANVRFGVVLSTAGGALKKMLLPFRMGLGGVIGGGKQYMSWVSIDDVVGMIQYVIGNDSMRGPVNLVSPHAVSNHEFTKTLGRVLHRPTIFPMPAFAARLAFGEMANELLLSSTRAVPKKLMNSGYKFRHPELGEAFEHLLKNAESISTS